MQSTQKELNDSIDELSRYRDRLRSEIINISQKLRMSKVRIQAALDSNDELKAIENTLKQLNSQIKSLGSSEKV